MADVGNGVVITELAGLHAGANPSSGDFSLLSKGYTIENGKRGAPWSKSRWRATSTSC